MTRYIHLKSSNNQYCGITIGWRFDNFSKLEYAVAYCNPKFKNTFSRKLGRRIVNSRFKCKKPLSANVKGTIRIRIDEPNPNVITVLNLLLNEPSVTKWQKNLIQQMKNRILAKRIANYKEKKPSEQTTSKTAKVIEKYYKDRLAYWT